MKMYVGDIVLTINIHFEPIFMAPLEAISGKQYHLTLHPSVT